MLFSSLFSSPLSFLFFVVALVAAITIHEFSHAYVADSLGDPTPRLQGRLTLNPLAHLDPLGTIMMFLVRFGWGKPVQFDPFNLRNPRRDAALISIAGPVSNIISAFIASILLRLLTYYGLALPTVGTLFLTVFLEQFIVLSVILAVFNFIPVHPLDGFKIVLGFLPEDQARQWLQLERYGIIFLFLLIFPLFGTHAPIAIIINPVIDFLLRLLLPGSSLI